MASIFDLLKGLIPQQPSELDVRKADLDLQQHYADQQVLGRNAVIQESVARQVREEMANVAQQTQKAKNIYPFDPNAMFAPEVTGDSLPGAGQDSRVQNYRTLQMLGSHPLISPIIGTRTAQMLEFARPQRHKNAFGYRVQMRDHNKVPSTLALKRAAEIETWISTCGNPDLKPQTFASLVKQTMLDTMRYDQLCVEVLLDKYGRPAKLIPTDAKYIRKAKFSPTDLARNRYAPDKQKYIQTFGYGKIEATWDSENFIFAVRNERTDLESRGYGKSELEVIAQQIYHFQEAYNINIASIVNGVHASGLLLFHSNLSPEMFKTVENKLRMLSSGASNAHRLQMMQLTGEKDSVTMLPFSKDNNEMEFSLLMSFLLKVICASFQMDPAEQNFIYGAEQQKSSMQGADPEERITASRERGIKPLLRFYEDWMNFGVVHNLDPDFEMLFCGLDNKSPLVQADLDTRAILSHATINEIRATKDLPAIDDWTCNVPGNPVTIAIMAQEKAAALQLQQQQEAQQAQQQAELQDRQRGMAEQMLLEHHAAANAPKMPDGPAPPTEIPAEFADEIYPMLLGDFAGNATDGDDGDIDEDVLHELQRSALPPGTTHEDLVSAEA